MVKPQTAWAAGATGKGVVIAVVDDGVKTGTHDLDGRISASSTDVVGTRNQPSASRDQHGTMVAGLAAANWDGSGTIGIAYESTVLSVRADELGPCGSDPGAAPNNDCGFINSDLARGIDYSTTHGARVLNLSLGGDAPSSPGVRQALLRATNAGLVVVAAAGNAPDGAAPSANPSYPARNAIDPAFNGQIIAVGALNAAGTDIASFSNRAGDTQNYFLLAPGQDVVSGCGLPSETTPGRLVCYVGSGTSFATPVVSGAAALLMSGFPNLNAHDVVDILLRSARDMGPAGTDPVYGRGALDIDRAFQPLGALSVPTSGGAITIADDLGAGAVGSAAVGDAFSSSAGLATVGYDDYHRLFRLNLGDAYRPATSRRAAPSAPSNFTEAGLRLTGPGGGTVHFSAVSAPGPGSVGGVAGLQARDDGLGDIAASFAGDHLKLDLWASANGGAPRVEAGDVDAYSGLAQPKQIMRAGLRFGAWTVSAEGGTGERTLGDAYGLSGAIRDQQPAASRYSRLLANFKNRYLSTTFGVGALQEEGGPLGVLAPAKSDLAMPAKSLFVTAQARWAPKDGVALTAEGGVGQTEAANSILKLREGYSSNWRIGAIADCSLFKLSCSGLSVELAQPVRLERAVLETMLAQQPDGYFDTLSFTERRVVVKPTGRELNLSISAWRPLGRGTARLVARAVKDEFNTAGAPLNVGVSASWLARF